jgi:hypothetical protein
MIYNIIQCEGGHAMTIARPRLTAALLCLLLVLVVGFILYHGAAAPGPAAPPMEMSLPDVVEEPAPPPAMPATRFAEDASVQAAGPAVSPTAAPGVAFDYRYAFRLPAARIAAVQEEHARLCERLTVVRCRIAGLYYHVVDANHVEARLALALDPAIARAFGRSGIAAVLHADGMLTESEIGGTDAGSAIRDAGRGLADLNADLLRIEAQLRATAHAPEQQALLAAQAEQLRAQIRALRDRRDADQRSLATTPMLFQYAAGVPAAAPSGPPTLAQAFDRALGNFVAGVTILLIVLVTLLPWLISALLVWMVVREVRRRWFAPAPATA